jgi:ABC-2 type transport system ATP-binding protein
MEFAIQTFNLLKKFNNLKAVNNINLSIKKGELFSLLGPNGAGKTTTINMLCCLLKPTSGTATVMGYDILKEPFQIKELIGVSPQETVLSEHLNCWENLSLIGRLHGIEQTELKRRSEELLEIMGLLPRAKEEVKKFSGGMKRRLNLIMALVHDPQILFLDEPTLGLDPQARRVIWEYILDLKRKEKTILLTTHYMEEADFLSDRIGIIDEGKIIALGKAGELRDKIIKEKTYTILVENFTEEIIKDLKEKYSKVKKIDSGVEISHPKIEFKEITDYLYKKGVKVNSATLKQPTLEDVFIELTGKKLRD